MAYFPATVTALIVLLALSYGNGQYVSSLQTPAEATALAGIRNGLSGVTAISGNTCGVLSTDLWTLQVSAKQHFGLRELAHIDLAAAVPLKANGGAVFGQVRHFGNSDYSEQLASIGYARKLSDTFSAAVDLSLLRQWRGEYGQILLPLTRLAFSGVLSEVLTMGVTVSNPFQSLENRQPGAPVEIAMGMRYDPNTLVSVFGEVVKNIHQSPIAKFAVAYLVNPRYTLMLGVASEGDLASFGISWRMHKALGLCIAASYHAYLGLTPAVSFTYSG